MKTTTSFSVRHPYVGEVPPELMQGFEAFKIDLEWQWVLVHEGKVKAQMLCANAHGMLFIIRLTADKGLPHGWAVAFFRHVMREAKSHGVLGFVTFLTDSNKKELRLMRIVQRLGGWLIPSSGAWACGSVEVNY